MHSYIKKLPYFNTVSLVVTRSLAFWIKFSRLRLHSHPRCWVADFGLRFFFLNTTATFLRLLGSKILTRRAQTDSSQLANVSPSFPFPPERPARHNTPQKSCYFPATMWCLIQKRHLLICNSCKNIQSVTMWILTKTLTFDVCTIINNGLMYPYGGIKPVFFGLWCQYLLAGRLLNRNESHICYVLWQSWELQKCYRKCIIYGYCQLNTDFLKFSELCKHYLRKTYHEFHKYA
jgi:hypothetical protein